jgi:hypothetical protein
VRFQDTLYNWLQIKLVCLGRPHDQAALDTEQFFMEMLREDHQVNSIEISGRDDTMIHVTFTIQDKTKKQMFDLESAELLLNEINAEPRYNMPEKVLGE